MLLEHKALDIPRCEQTPNQIFDALHIQLLVLGASKYLEK